MNTESTPQQVAIDAIKEKLNTMELMQKYFHDRQMKKFSKTMRGLINDKTAELRALLNHVSEPIEADAREEWIKQVEDELAAAVKENKRLTVLLANCVPPEERQTENKIEPLIPQENTTDLVP